MPTHHDYTESVDILKSFFDTHGLEYCIYGSFLVPGKVRHGLSDIDLIVISDTPQLVFPIGITRTFGEVKQRIAELGVPIQINFVTLGQWNSPLLTLDAGYLKEVEKGLKGNYYSSEISEILRNKKSLRNENEDDKNMMRYFHRKIQELGTYIPDIEGILNKDGGQITQDDQHKIFQFWDAFKKMITYVGTSIRVKSGESVFHLKDRELFDIFSKNFGTTREYHPTIDSYLGILESIKNINHWYCFLKKGGIEKIVHIYTYLFALIFSKTSDYIRN